MKYEIKTANFVAEIENDEQLSQLAKVGTLKKDTKIRMMPNGQWMPAKNLPVLQVVWGLVPAANVPSIERPAAAGTGIRRLNSAPPIYSDVSERNGAVAGLEVPPPAPCLPPRVSNLPPPAPKVSPNLPPPAPKVSPNLPPPAPKLPPQRDDLFGIDEPRSETVVDRAPRFIEAENEAETAQVARSSDEKMRENAVYSGRDAQKLADSMRSHDLEVLESLELEVEPPCVDLDKDIVFRGLSDAEDEAGKSTRKSPSSVALESTMLLTDDMIQQSIVEQLGKHEASSSHRSEIVEAVDAYPDEDDSKTKTNWADDLPENSEETVAMATNPFYEGAQEDSDAYDSVDISLEEPAEGKSEIKQDDPVNIQNWIKNDTLHGTGKPAVAQRVPLSNRRIRKNVRSIDASDEMEVERVKTSDASALLEERTTHDVKFLDYFIEKAQTKPIITPSDLAEALYEEDETRERSHVDEARLHSLVDAVSSSNKATCEVDEKNTISSVIDEEDETRSREALDEKLKHQDTHRAPSSAPVRTFSPADISAARAAIERAQKKLNDADKLDVRELRETANLMSSAFEAIMNSQISAVLEDNDQDSVREADLKSSQRVSGSQWESSKKQVSDAHKSASEPQKSEKLFQTEYRVRSESQSTEDDADEFDESKSEQFTVHSREELEAMMRAFSQQEKEIQKLSGDHEALDGEDLEEDEPSSTEKLRVHKRLDMRHLDPMELDESESVSINLPLATRSIPPVQAGELRSLFEKEDELHIFLANEIRTVESNCNKEALKDEAINYRPAPRESCQNGKRETTDPSMSVQDTVMTSAVGSGESENSIVTHLHTGENQVARFGSFILTNRNIWKIEKSKFGLKNYESYDLKNVQWFALREERNWKVLVLDVVFALITLVVALGLYLKGMHENWSILFHASIILCGWSILMLPVLYMISYKTSLQIGLGSVVVKSRERIHRGEHLEAAKFLEYLDRERMKIQKHERQSK